MLIKHLSNKHFTIIDNELNLIIHINPPIFEKDCLNIFTKETITPAKNLIALDLPWEYEVSNCFVKGISAGQYTLFNIQVDERSISVITDFNEKELNSKQTEKLGETDYLILYLSSDLNFETAKNIIEQIEPPVVILAGEKEETKKIITNFSNTEQFSEYTFKSSDLINDSVKIIHLN